MSGSFSTSSSGVYCSSTFNSTTPFLHLRNSQCFSHTAEDADSDEEEAQAMDEVALFDVHLPDGEMEEKHCESCPESCM